MKLKTLLLLTTILVSAALPAAGQTNATVPDVDNKDAPPASPAAIARQRNKAAADAAYAENMKRHAGDGDMLVKPGLLANRKEKWVRVDAEAVSLKQFDPVEFLLTAEGSGKEYESLAVSFAKPSDIHEALVFTGMRPGVPVDREKQRFWPKGERVIITVDWDADKHFHVRAESLVFNRKAGKTLPEDGFVFVGSAFQSAPDEPGKTVYAADAFAPNSIVSSYNDPQTVLDVPRVAEQTAVYESQFPNPEYSFATGQWLRVTMEPEYKDSRRRVTDLVILIGTRTNGPAAGAVSNLVFRISDTAGKTVADGVIRDMPAALEKLTGADREPHTTVQFDGALPLSVIHEFCKFLAGIDTVNGIRIGQPPAGHVFYQAFIPNENWRDRENRSVQPWEMRIKKKKRKFTGTLLLTEDIMNRQTDQWTTRTREFDASTPEAVRKALNTMRDDGETLAGLPTVLIFAPNTMLYRELMPFAAATLETRPYIHVFLE